MSLMSPGMQRIYELLAFVVALFFPAALVTWMVIDKLFATGNGKGDMVQQGPEGGRRHRAITDRSER